MNAIAHRAGIDEIVAHRNRAIALYGEAFDALDTANSAVAAATHTGGMRCYPHLSADGDRSGARSREEFMGLVRPNIDRAIWRYLLDVSGMERLMDAKARDEFRVQLEKDPPEVTADTCRATMEQLIGDADLIFKRGIANAFSGLDRRFRSHDGFKIGSRVILSWFYCNGSINSRQKDVLRDIERTFHVLEGKPQPDYHAGICGQMDAARNEADAKSTAWLSNVPFEVTGPYFRVKAYKNGNAHLWFSRDDLVERVNLLLADHYGATLGEGPDAADPGHAPSGKVARNLGFFETPDAVVQKVIEAAGFYRDAEGASVLEPSAGLGRIALAAKAKGANVTCAEIHPERAAALRYYGFKTIEGDFLKLSPATVGQFDAVLMNPPFDRGLDVEHVAHAMGFLKPGGRLVAIMSASTEFREDRRTLDFRAKVKTWGGEFRDLPAGSFAESGTYVNTLILSARKPA